MTLTTIKDGEYTATVYKMIKDGRYGEAIHILSHELQKQMKDFTNAAECYEQLTQLHPEVEEYKLYYAQSLYGACAYPEAMKATFLLDNPTSHTKMIKLQAAIKYGEEEYSGAKTLVEQLPQDDPDYEVDMGCLLYKEGEYEEACKKFMSAMQVLGYQPDLSYNIGLCYYSMKQYAQALKFIGEIIERGIREHPELSVGMTTEGIDVRSDAAQEALTDMPPRSEEELDPVTLHNQALMNMDKKPSEGFEKLAFLLQQIPFPPVTFGNLLLLYCKYEYLYEFLDAMLTCQTAPEEAFRKFDEMNAKLTDQLRKLAKQVQEARLDRDNEALKKTLQDYDEMVEKYIPVLMAQAKIYWNRENYQMVEKIFRKSVEFCNEHDTWKLNVAHVLFMQENKYKEAIGFYEPIVKKHYDNAEELMRKIEKEEEELSYDDPDKKVFHLCIGNYDFGITRVIKSLEPYNKKRCFLSLLENMAKHMIMIRDSVVQECIQFLEHCEVYGKTEPAMIEQPLEEDRMHIGKNTVTYESRLLKALFYEVIGWNQ
ncbi:unnamed protein product [Coregonus sp. 'balchen']|nr:unnamed protein product [Coregonus sp. 'balchen']